MGATPPPRLIFFLTERDKMPKTHVRIVIDTVVSHSEGVDMEHLIRKETEFLAEPKTAHGTVAAMTIMSVEIIPRRRIDPA